MGQRDLRRLLISGAMAEVSWAVRRGRAKDPWLASVLIQKFLFNFRLDAECPMAEAFDGGQDVVGGFGPAERCEIAVVGLDISLDGGFEFGSRAVGAALDLLLGQQGEEALDLVDPRGGCRREVPVPVRALGEPVADQLGLVARRVVHDDMDVEVVGHVSFHGVEEGAELP